MMGTIVLLMRFRAHDLDAGELLTAQLGADWS
jgi:hypothetical protein